VIGGGSSINGQAMQRGFPEDFDSWAALDNDEWSYERVVPYLFCDAESLPEDLTSVR
jgi:5-(hydroxymethyl)furfural/furfural oxidase